MGATNLHDIQRKILERLGYGKRLTFSALRGDTPSNKFSFHLNQLQENGLIEKGPDGYALTADGTELLPYLDPDTAERPVTEVCLFVHGDGEVYLEEADENPLDVIAGTLRVPAARSRKGADLEAVAAELYEERFDGSPELALAAVFEVSIRFGNGAVQERVQFWFAAEDEGGGEGWYAVEETAGEDFLPGTGEAVEAVLAPDGFVHGLWELEHGPDGLELAGFETL